MTARRLLPATLASGEKIVFSHTVGKHQVIDVMRADGSHKRALTRRHLDRTPAFSPTGEKVVFSRVINANGGQHSELFTVRSDGTHLTQLTHSKLRSKDQPCHLRSATGSAARVRRIPLDPLRAGRRRN